MMTSTNETLAEDKESSPSCSSGIKIYRRRWLMLMLFILYSATNSFQWIQYSIITETVKFYYNVSTSAVDWTSIIYMVLYIPLVFFASWLIDKKNLKFPILMGSFGTALGAWIKCSSVHPDRFYLTFIGQTIVAASQIFILGIPPKLSSVWFGCEEVSTACALGVFGNQVGIALGFLIPPLIISKHVTIQDIGSGLLTLYIGVAIVTTVSFVSILIFFQDHPPKPPSISQLIQSTSVPRKFLKSICYFAKNVNFVVLLVSYGLNVGVFYAVSVLLGQMINEYFPDSTTDAGWMGLGMILAGVAGSVVAGIVLDKTHRFKETTVILYGMTLICMLIYTLTLSQRIIWIAYVTIILLGFFMTGYLPVGFEFASELTFPEAEATSSGLLNCSAQIFGIAFTIFASYLREEYGGFSCNIMLTVTLAIGTILTAVIKNDLRRQTFQKQYAKQTNDSTLPM